jgi:hypothetical protein
MDDCLSEVYFFFEPIVWFAIEVVTRLVLGLDHVRDILQKCGQCLILVQAGNI